MQRRVLAEHSTVARSALSGMQGDMASDAERKAFYESARQQAEEDWSKDKSDSHALTRWGGAFARTR